MGWKKVKTIGVSLSLVALVLSGCSQDSLKNKDNEEARNTSDKNEKVIKFDVQNKLHYGEKGAPNEIVVFGDFECGACQSFHGDTMDLIKEKYINTGEAKVYLFDLAFISEVSLVKSLLAVAIEKKYPEYYTKYVDAVYDLNQEESEKFKNKELVENKLNELFPGLDSKTLVDMVFGEDNELINVIKANKDIVEENNIKSTPAVFINGVQMENPFDVEELKNKMKKPKDNK